jgi:hypothetical protein
MMPVPAVIVVTTKPLFGGCVVAVNPAPTKIVLSCGYLKINTPEPPLAAKRLD